MYSIKPGRRGLTLTELLVTISILVIVTAVLAPLLTPSLEGREVREAARQVNVYFQQARAKSRELGRPVGVVIRRGPVPDPTLFDESKDYAYQLSMAEEPPTYSGIDAASRASVNNGFAQIFDATDPVSFGKQVQPNDHIRFNFRGDKYRILRTEFIPAAAASGGTPAVPAHYLLAFETMGKAPLSFLPNSRTSFEVFRRPKLTSSTPIELPTNTALIMSLSGVGMDYRKDIENGVAGQYPPQFPAIGLTEFQRAKDSSGNLLAEQADTPIIVMFTPNGNVSDIYRYRPNTPILAHNFPPKRTKDKIYLFLGKDGIDHWTNLADTSNLWITIDPDSGLVTSAPNLPPAFQPTATDGLRAVAESRQIAATGQNMGGG